MALPRVLLLVALTLLVAPVPSWAHPSGQATAPTEATPTPTPSGGAYATGDDADAGTYGADRDGGAAIERPGLYVVRADGSAAR